MSYYVFNYAKTIISIGPSIAKETVLAKVLNEIDAFRMSLSPGYDDVNKRYLESIQKMDNSKTVMLDLKGPEIKTRVDHDMTIKKGQKVYIKYTEFFEDEEDTIFIDYPSFDDVPQDEIITIKESDIKIKIIEFDNGKLIGKVIEGGIIKSNKEFFFDSYVPKLNFVTKKDEKDIIWCVNNGVKVVIPSVVRFGNDIKTLRQALTNLNGKDIKIIAKIETLEAIENIEDILKEADGILISDKLRIKTGDAFGKHKEMIIKNANIYGKPAIVAAKVLPENQNKPSKELADEIIKDIYLGIDGFALTDEVAYGSYPTEAIEEIYKIIVTHQSKVTTDYKFQDIHTTKENSITDYIIHNAYRIAKEFDIKVILCPSESGYTPAKLSALKPGIPIISFTKNDATYRYLNALWGVKGYKVATGFNYDNIKRIGKEIIRFMNKGDMSLDVKVLIVHSTITQNVPNMINGIEIYRFKDL